MPTVPAQSGYLMQKTSVWAVFDVYERLRVGLFDILRWMFRDGECLTCHIWLRIFINVERDISCALPGFLLFLMEQSIQMELALRAIFLGEVAALFSSFSNINYIEAHDLLRRKKLPL